MAQEEAVALYEKAKMLAKAKKYEEAVMYFNKALNINPKYKEAQNERGNVLLMLGKTDEALDSFNTATLIDPTYVEAWKNKEAVHLLRGDYDEAVKCLDQILGLNPKDEFILLSKGALLTNLHRYRESVECFDKVLAINPQSPEALSKKADALKHIEGITVKEMKRIAKKICLLGNGAVGKTSLIRRYVYDVFDDKYLSTIGAKVTKKVLSLRYQEPRPDVTLTLMVWDIAGQEDFKNVHPTYYQGTDAALIVCDVTRKETFDDLIRWAEALFKVSDKVPIVFLGNKCDMAIQMAVSEKDLERVAKQFNTIYLLTSAKTGKNVEEAFSAVSKALLEGQ